MILQVARDGCGQTYGRTPHRRGESCGKCDGDGIHSVQAKVTMREHGGNRVLGGAVLRSVSLIYNNRIAGTKHVPA